MPSPYGVISAALLALITVISSGMLASDYRLESKNWSDEQQLLESLIISLANLVRSKLYNNILQTRLKSPS
jgi:hypothetical protein